MTKKDYIAVAAILKSARETVWIGPDAAHLSINGIESDLIKLFARDNPRFDGGRFARASAKD